MARNRHTQGRGTENTGIEMYLIVVGILLLFPKITISIFSIVIIVGICIALGVFIYDE